MIHPRLLTPLYIATFKAFLATCLVFLITQFSDLEIIRAQVEDIAFEQYEKFYQRDRVENLVAPQTILLLIDDLYLKENDLENYGYLFPRDHLAKIISRIDQRLSRNKSAKIKPQNSPNSSHQTLGLSVADQGSTQDTRKEDSLHVQALFIDYDLQFSTMPYGQKLSVEDQTLINVLNQTRDYPILLPKLAEQSFIDQHLQSENLGLASVYLSQDEDQISRRWIPAMTIAEKPYFFAPLLLWLNHHQACGKISLTHLTRLNLAEISKQCQLDFNAIDSVQRRIIHKNYQLLDPEINLSKSRWQNLITLSAQHLESLSDETLQNAILLLGADHSKSSDYFATQAQSKSFTSGVSIHADALMTLFYFNGFLVSFEPKYAAAVIFFSIIIFELIMLKIYQILLIDSREFQLLINLSLLSMILMFVSDQLMQHRGVWFNWFVPVALNQCFDIFKVWKKYYLYLKGWLQALLHSRKET